MLYTLPDLAVPIRRLGAAHRRQDDGDPPRQTPRGLCGRLNKALEGHDVGNLTIWRRLLAEIDTLPEEIRAAVRNHGGGHANHSLFWTTCRRRAAGSRGATWPGHREASSAVSTASPTRSPRPRWAASAAAGPGSASNPDGRLLVESTANQDSPWMCNARPSSASTFRSTPTI